MVNGMSVDKGKTGAVGKAQVGEVELSEQGRCFVFNHLRHPQDRYAKAFETIHKIDGGGMAASASYEGIGFIQDIV